MLVLLRHAHAANKRTWAGPDAARPLTARGREQASGMAALLAGLDLTTIRTSPTERCRQTVAPLATAMRTPPVDDARLLPDAELSVVLPELAAPAARGTVFCTHGELIQTILAAWRQAGTVALPASTSTAKGGAWVVRKHPGARAEARYLPPRPPG